MVRRRSFFSAVLSLASVLLPGFCYATPGGSLTELTQRVDAVPGTTFDGENSVLSYSAVANVTLGEEDPPTTFWLTITIKDANGSVVTYSSTTKLVDPGTSSTMNVTCSYTVPSSHTATYDVEVRLDAGSPVDCNNASWTKNGGM